MIIFIYLGTPCFFFGKFEQNVQSKDVLRAAWTLKTALFVTNFTTFKISNRVNI